MLWLWAAIFVLLAMHVASQHLTNNRLDIIDAQLTTLETIRVVRPAPVMADTIPVIIRLPDDVLGWD